MLIFVAENESVDRFEQLATTEKNAKTRHCDAFSTFSDSSFIFSFTFIQIFKF